MTILNFYETYYFCNVVKNIVNDQFSYAVKLNDFYGDGNIFYMLEPFSKFSVFHGFIEFVIDNVYQEEFGKLGMDEWHASIKKHSYFPCIHESPRMLPIEHALSYHEISFVTFETYLKSLGKDFFDGDDDDVYYYVNDFLLSEYGLLLEQTTVEVFHVLFQNRALMMEFNHMISDALERELEHGLPEEFSPQFSQSRKLKRKHIPKWVKRAVFHRDKGHCTLCNKDVSGVLSLESKENYDHIIPLAKYGLNDVSNIQLLCKDCNQLEKRAGVPVTSNRYQSWF